MRSLGGWRPPSGNGRQLASGDDGEGVVAVVATHAVQGMLEASNVQPVIEISNMIEIMRTYQATSNLSQTQHSQDMQSIDKLAQVQD